MEIPKDLEDNLNKIFTEAKKKVREGYTNDLNFYINNKFYFDAAHTNLEKEFNDTIDDYIKKLENKQNNALNSLTFNKEFNKTLVEHFESKIYNDINSYQKQLSIIFASLGEKNCILLNYNLILNDILSDAISELKNEISYKIKNNLEFRYQNPLQEFKNLINKYFKKFNYNFKEN